MLEAQRPSRPPSFPTGAPAPTIPERRCTTSVIVDHVWRRQSGDLESDLTRNYADDVVVVSGRVYRGHDGVREIAQSLGLYSGSGPPRMEKCTTAGTMAYVEWNGDGNRTAESFVVENGRIVAQIITPA